MIVKHLLESLQLQTELEQCTVDQYARALRKLGEYLGRESDVSDLSLETINGFLANLKAKGLTGTTVRNYRVSIVRLWNVAIDEGLAEPFNPRKLRSPRIERRPVRSWSPSQVTMLLSAAERLEGRLQCGVNRSDFLAAWIRVGYDTGLRPSDLRLLRWSDVDLSEGTIVLTQHKTRRPHAAKLSKTSIKCLMRIEHPSRQLVFPMGKGGMRKLELLLFAIAHPLGFRRIRGQGLGTLRKCHATAIYERDGETAAAESLGHVGGTRTVRMHYIDARSIKAGRLPPEPKAG
jgi:integrase